jgi:hypothetical protein
MEGGSQAPSGMPLMLRDLSLLAHAAALSHRQVGGVPGLLLYSLLVWLLPLLLLLFVGGLIVRAARPAVTRGAGFASCCNAKRSRQKNAQKSPGCCKCCRAAAWAPTQQQFLCITDMHSCRAYSHQQVPCTGCR